MFRVERNIVRTNASYVYLQHMNDCETAADDH